jgi:hypothetical protein
MIGSFTALPLFRGSVRALVVLGLSAFTALGAQTPRFGPDDARFKVSTTSNMSTSIMGTSMDIGMDIQLFINVKVTAAGRDTLRFHGVVDSVSFAMNSPIMAQMGLSASDMSPHEKGDSAVFLMSTNGAMLRHVAGDDGMAGYFAFTKGIPNDLALGGSWTFSTVDSASVATAMSGAGAGPGAGAMAGLLGGLTQAMGTTTSTYHGQENRMGTRAWRFVASGAAPTSVVPMPEMNGTMTVKTLTGNGEIFVDLTGKLLHRSYESESEQEISVQGFAIGSTNSSKLVIERIR